MEPLIWETWIPGAMASTSGIEVAPERRISSWLITYTGAGVLARLCGFLPTEVMVTCISWERSISR